MVRQADCGLVLKWWNDSPQENIKKHVSVCQRNGRENILQRYARVRRILSVLLYRWVLSLATHPHKVTRAINTLTENEPRAEFSYEYVHKCVLLLCMRASVEKYASAQAVKSCCGRVRREKKNEDKYVKKDSRGVRSWGSRRRDGAEYSRVHGWRSGHRAYFYYVASDGERQRASQREREAKKKREKDRCACFTSTSSEINLPTQKTRA